MANDVNVWNPLSWFQSPPGGWLGGIGGGIASGIEGGFMAVLKDLWLSILGFVEIIIGVVILFWVISLYFAEDAVKLAAVIGKMVI